MARKPKLTAKKKKEFLDKLAEFGIVTDAARHVNISRVVLYKHRRQNEKFAEDWEAAVAVGDQGLLAEARARATRKSDLLLMFLIKGRFPEYRDKFQVEASGAFSLEVNTRHPDDKDDA